MSRQFFLWICLLALLTGCEIIQPDKEKEFKIQQLQKEKDSLRKEKESLVTEKEELQLQNEKLAATGSKLLDRLSGLQKRYRDLSDENKELSEQNQDLHQKLYQERIYKQKKFQEETQKDADELQKEAEKLFRNYDRTDTKEKINLEKEIKSKNLEEIPEEKLFQKEAEIEENTKDVEESSILERLETKRQRLLKAKLWTQSDESTLEDIKKILKSSISSEEKLKTIQEALEFEKKLESREVL